MASENIVVLGDADFKNFVDNSQIPVMVDFWAQWCGPCRMIAPVLEEVAADYKDKVHIAKVNVDENKATPTGFGIVSIPTMIVFKGGQEMERIVGFKSKKELQTILDKYIG